MMYIPVKDLDSIIFEAGKEVLNEGVENLDAIASKFLPQCNEPNQRLTLEQLKRRIMKDLPDIERFCPPNVVVSEFENHEQWEKGVRDWAIEVGIDRVSALVETLKKITNSAMVPHWELVIEKFTAEKRKAAYALVLGLTHLENKIQDQREEEKEIDNFNRRISGFESYERAI